MKEPAIVPATIVPRCGLAAGAERLSLALLVVCLTVRPFLAELPYRSSPIPPSVFASAQNQGAPAPAVTVDRSDVSRVVLASLLLAAVVTWRVGRLIRGGLPSGAGWLGTLTGVFGALSLLSVLRLSDARDARGAWIVWLEQLSLLSACWLAAKLFADGRRFRLLLAVLAAVGATLAIKAFWQVSLDIPQRVADFEVRRDEILSQFGWAAGTSQARLIEARLRDPSATGFFPLANLFASMLILLLGAAAALAAEKFFAAGLARKDWKVAARAGEIHLPTVAVIVATVLAAFVAAGLLLSRSRAGIAAGAAAAVAAFVIYRFRAILARHWWKAVLVAAAAFLLSVSAAVAWGLKHDALPGRSMTFRWYYWTAGAEMVRDHPLLGVGPGQFGSAYLRYRRPEAEEAVKLPHNIIVHAFAQYGLPGGACYLAILACVFWSVCRPRGTAPAPAVGDGIPRSASIVVVAGLPVAAIAARAFLGGIYADPLLLLLEAVLPALVLAGMLTAALWRGGGTVGPSTGAGTAARILAGCGLLGFALHGMVEFGPWAPATGLAFWTLAGACAAQGDRPARQVPRLKWLAVSGEVWWWMLAGAAGFIIAVFVNPIYRKQALTEAAVARFSARDYPSAIRLAEQAAQADRLDAVAASDAARIILWSPGGDRKRAYSWAVEAIERDPVNPAYHQTAAGICRAWSPEQALAHEAEAVRFDPRNLRLRIEYAEGLCDAGRLNECLHELAAADEIDRSLLPESVERLTPAERQKCKGFGDRASRQLKSSADSGPVH